MVPHHTSNHGHPQKDETLLIYIAVTNRVVSTAIVVEQEEARHVYKVQCPVYFISKVLNESKTTDTRIADLTEVFKALKVYRWKLNPTK